MAETLFHCEDALWRRFVALCRDRGETPDAALRDLVRLEVRRTTARKAAGDDTVDGQQHVRLCLIVSAALAKAETWADLQSALRLRGLRFVASATDLVLTDLVTSKPLARSSEVGPGYHALIRRFRAGFPGHPWPDLAVLALAQG